MSVAEAKGMKKKTVYDYLKKLEGVLKEYELFEIPRSLFNVDETGLQLNNKPGEVAILEYQKPSQN